MFLEDVETKKAAQKAKRAEYMRTVFYPKHREKIKAYQAEYHRANPELKNGRERARRANDPARVRESNRLYRATHVEEERARKAARYEENRESIRLRQADYRVANSDKWADAQRRRRARLRKAPVVERFAAREIYERDSWICQLCGLTVTKRDVTLDHIVPLFKGGPHTRSNVQTAHRGCNSQKGRR